MRKYIKIHQIFTFYATFGIPLLYLYNLGVIFIYPGTMRLPIVYLISGLIIAFIGIVFWIISFATLGLAKSFGVLPQKQKRITHGIYKYLKHPMYIGIWLTFTGLSLANQSKAGLLFTNFIMLPLLIIRAVLEEKKLEN